jgi:7,8-dihydro-6-hydroxymethylpterin-pyrophosphokinase
VECLLGRKHTAKWSPRTIDLDLLFFDDEIIRTDYLAVPHPRLHERRFVLEPLCEIAPELIHPIKSVPIKTLLKKLEDNKKVVPLYKFSLSQSSEGVLQKPLRDRL